MCPRRCSRSAPQRCAHCGHLRHSVSLLARTADRPLSQAPVVTSAAGVGMGERGAGPHPSLTEPPACRPLTAARSSTCFHSLYCGCLRRQGDRQGRVRAARGPPSGGEGALQKEGPLRASGCLLHGYSQANGHCRWEPSAPPCADSAGTHCSPVSGAAATAPSRFWASF